jgi:hypothetical protein
MSTKSTIRLGKNWHFYREAFDQDHVYLELEGSPFEATNDRVMVAIPVATWEVIRHHQEAGVDLLDKSPEELRQQSEAEVRERVERARAERESTGQVGLWGLIGVIPYGSIDDPMEEQIERGYQYFRDQQQRQWEVQHAIEELEAENAPLIHRDRSEKA